MQKQTITEMVQMQYVKGKHNSTIVDSINNILSKEEGKTIDLIKDMERFKALMKPTIAIK